MAATLGRQRQRLLGGAELDVRPRALEVVALADLLAGLIQRIVNFLEIDRGRDVER